MVQELRIRRAYDEYAAAVVMQGCGRMLLGKLRVRRMKSDIARSGEIKDLAAQRIQAFYRATQGRFRMKQSKQEREIVMRFVHFASSHISSVHIAVVFI